MLCASNAGLHNSVDSYDHTAAKKTAMGHRGRFKGERSDTSLIILKLNKNNFSHYFCI
jgi:hypothetical protein